MVAIESGNHFFYIGIINKKEYKMNYFLNSKLRILNFTHIDLDGATSNIVIRNYFKDVITHQITYEHENEIIPKMIKEKDKFDAVIFTDFCPVNLTQVQAFGRPVLVLDHHESALSFNDPSKNVYICSKFCGAKLTYEFFNHDDCLKHLDELVNITNDFDLYKLKDQRSKPFNHLYWAMGFSWFVERFMTGDIELSKSEMKYLVRRQKDYNEFYANLPIQELKNNGVVCVTEKYLSDVADSLRNDGYDWCILYRNGNLSLRSSENSNINLVNVTKRLGKGGGHYHAVGVPQQKENLSDLIKRIETEVDNELKDVKMKEDQNDFMKRLQDA